MSSISIAPALFPYENGFIKEFTREEFLRMVGISYLNQIWPIYNDLRIYGNSRPPALAAAARELAAEHFPDQQALASEYIYLRLLMGTTTKTQHLCFSFNEALHRSPDWGRPQKIGIEAFLVPGFPHHRFRPETAVVYSQMLHQAAAKLVKAGWKSHTNGDFAGTEFQRVESLCYTHKIKEGLIFGLDLLANKLDEALATL